jgi:hypothetical protein
VAGTLRSEDLHKQRPDPSDGDLRWVTVISPSGADTWTERGPALALVAPPGDRGRWSPRPYLSLSPIPSSARRWPEL